MFPERRQPVAYCVISQDVTEYSIPDCFSLHGSEAGGIVYGLTSEALQKQLFHTEIMTSHNERIHGKTPPKGQKSPTHHPFPKQK